MKYSVALILIIAMVSACTAQTDATDSEIADMNHLQKLLSKYAPVNVQTRPETLNENQKRVLDKLIAASDIIDTIYWKQASRQGLLLRKELTEDPSEAAALKLHFLEINKFAYDRLDANAPFLDVPPLPEGATFWPEDLTRDELDAYVVAHPDQKEKLYSLTTVVRRDGEALVAVPYRVLFSDELDQAARLLREAADLSRDEAFSRYLRLRAEALVTDDYFDSDMAWMDLGDSTFDLVIGAIEVYEDGLMNLKAAYEAYVLVKDQAASDELAGYINAMEDMQKDLPVEPQFKQRSVQLGSSVGVFTQVYGAGQSEAGSKTIAISLPNDPRVREAKGARKVMLRNAIEAKFNTILKPIAEEMMAEDQVPYVDGDSFFSNVLLHEISHSLGNDYVLAGDGTATEVTIDEALKERSTAIEECKADIGGLYALDVLIENGMLPEKARRLAYTTYTAGIFRSVRFGASSAHGVANAIAINWLQEKGGIAIDDAGKYRVHVEPFHAAVESLLAEVLTIQHTGDYQRAVNLIEQYGSLPDALSRKLAAMDTIPVDIEFIWQ